MHFRPLLLAVMPVALCAQVGTDSVISVSAGKSVQIAADRVSLYVALEGVAETVDTAFVRADLKASAVRAVLEARARVFLEAPIPYSVGAAPTTGGLADATATKAYLARSIIRVSDIGVERLAHVVSLALGAGAAGFSIVAFEATTADSVRQACISEALGVAQRDAEVIAAAFGGRLGEVIDVRSTGGSSFPAPAGLTSASRLLQQSLAPEVTIVANVLVRYRLVR